MNRPRILLVDDNDMLTAVCSRTLTSSVQAEVRMVNRGSEALAAALAFRPDLILLDCNMPDRSGREVYDEIRACEEVASTPIAFLSSERVYLPDPNMISLTKPIHFQELITRIEAFLEARGHRFGDVFA